MNAWIIFLLIGLCLFLWSTTKKVTGNHSHRKRIGRTRAKLQGFPEPKPPWVKDALLALHDHSKESHRKLADTFNRIYFAETGVSVGRTWVRETIKKREYERLHMQKSLKHRLPPPLAKNAVWGIDTTSIRDAQGVVHCALGIIDHGSRRCLRLRQLEFFNAWTFLGHLFLVVGEYGKPHSIKTDNHAVFHSRRVQQVLRWARIRSTFSAPGKPWQNGRIERFFGTLKEALAGHIVADQKHLARTLAQFEFWYNVTRAHQHLNGLTPSEAWDGINPLCTPVKAMHAFVAWDGRLKGMVLRR